MTVAELAAYDQCVFAVAEGLNGKHGAKAVHVASEYAGRAEREGDDFGIGFWHDVMRAIDAADPVPAPPRLN